MHDKKSYQSVKELNSLEIDNNTFFSSENGKALSTPNNVEAPSTPAEKILLVQSKHFETCKTVVVIFTLENILKVNLLTNFYELHFY